MRIPIISKHKQKINDARSSADKLFKEIYKTLEDNYIETSQTTFIEKCFKSLEYELWDNYILSQHCNSIKKINKYKSNMRRTLEYWQWFRTVPESQYGKMFKINLSSYYGYMKGN